MKKVRNILIIIAFYILMAFHFSEVQAASATISANKTSATVGETITITVSVNAAAWNIHVTGAATGTFADSSDNGENTSFTKQVTFTPSAPGNYTVSMDGDVSEGSNNETKPIKGNVSIAVQGKTATSTPTSTTTNTNSSTNTPTAPATTTTKPETPKKSNNAKLSNLGFTPNDFKGFTANKTSYSATVPNSVSSIEIYAKKGQSGQTISGTGKKTLQEGANQFSVTVTAEDGTTKNTYTLSITREAATAQEDKNTTENETTNETAADTNTVEEPTTDTKDSETKLTVGLSKLSITGVTLSPTFQKDVYEYTAKLIGDKTMLDINTTAIDEGQTVEIVGNEDLKEGENIITIMVTDEKDEKTATYQITVNKSLVDEEAIAKEKEKEEQEKRQNMTILAVIVGAIIIVSLILIVRYIRYRREEDDDDYDNEYFEDNEDDEDDEPETVKQERAEVKLPKYKKEEAQEVDEMQEFDNIEERIRKKKSKGKRFKD